jgi:hypothetical protein
MHRVTGINRSKRGKQLAENEEIDSVQSKVDISRNFVALDGAADAAALALLQLLPELIQAAANARYTENCVPHTSSHLPSNESSWNGLNLPSLCGTASPAGNPADCHTFALRVECALYLQRCESCVCFPASPCGVLLQPPPSK